MQPKVAQLTIKIGGSNRPLCAKIKAQKHKRGLNMDITTANRLYELRKQHGYSQDELADKLNVSRQAISKWERSESSPDTDNLIALAKLYGVSLDELLNYTPAKSGEESKESQAQTQDDNTAENAQSAVEDDKNDTSSFDYEENGDRVHIDENGIHVQDKDGSNVIIKGGIAKLVNKIVGDIHVENGKTTINGKVVDNDDDDDDDDDDEHVRNNTVRIENGHITFENKKAKSVAVAASIVNGVTFLLCVAAYLLIGFLCKLWHPGWLLFFVPFIVGGTFECIAKRNPSAFPVPIIVTAVYLLLGCGWGLWHPYWVIFLIVPAYYAVVEPIKSAVKKKRETVQIHIDTDDTQD